MLTKSSIIFAMVFSSAYAGEVQYIHPRIPSEAEKIEALKLGYLHQRLQHGRPHGWFDRRLRGFQYHRRRAEHAAAAGSLGAAG